MEKPNIVTKDKIAARKPDEAATSAIEYMLQRCGLYVECLINAYLHVCWGLPFGRSQFGTRTNP